MHDFGAATEPGFDTTLPALSQYRYRERAGNGARSERADGSQRQETAGAPAAAAGLRAT